MIIYILSCACFFLMGVALILLNFYLKEQRTADYLKRYIKALPERERIERASGVFIDTHTGQAWHYSGIGADRNGEYMSVTQILALLLQGQDRDLFVLIADKGEAMLKAHFDGEAVVSNEK